MLAVHCVLCVVRCLLAVVCVPCAVVVLLLVVVCWLFLFGLNVAVRCL